MNYLKKFLIIAILALVVPVAVRGADPAAPESGKVIKITAKKFEYNPNKITLKKGVPVTLEFTSLDRLHGFSCPDLGIRGDILPGKGLKIQFTPQKAGTFPFHCDIFCGEGHENMTGEFIVTE
ncbi:MAG TPA: cupredoxin domain-containing protein [Geobacteraceae bacterium]|nr:cupredoxin domain-containing protein [Geobacteraceae bacterium]